MKYVKLALGVLFAVLTLVFAGFQVRRLGLDPSASDAIGAMAGTGLVALFSFLFFYSALYESGGSPPKTTQIQPSLMDKMRQPIGPIGPNRRLRIVLANARGLEGKMPGDVGVVFHTYWGFLVFFVQTEWRFALPPEEARRVLWTMHKSNLSWGLLAPGAIFIPILSQVEYWQQMRSIRRQEASLPHPSVIHFDGSARFTI